MAFLAFFFKQLRVNDTDHYQKEFPYLSPCGREKNYVRCDDLPIVFTSLVKSLETEELVLPYNYCGSQLAVPFQPSKLYMGSSGRVYHPGPENLHGIGLIKSQIALELSNGFQFSERGSPTHLKYGEKTYELDNSLKTNLLQIGRTE